MVVRGIPKQVPRMEQYLVFFSPVVDGGAEDTQAGAEDGPEDGPVLGLLLTCC